MSNMMAQGQASHSELTRTFITVMRKVKLLSSLRNLVSLKCDHDITERQWAAIELPLLTVESSLMAQLKEKGKDYIMQIHLDESRKALSLLLGQTELALAKSLVYFDTFMDLLSQRHLPKMGLILGGCDVLALDALRKNHPILSSIEQPLVSFNRGFGASILRQGVPMVGGTQNPLATIQIPYTKLMAKYNLTSVIHEVGHLAMVQLGLVNDLPNIIIEALADIDAPKSIQKLFAMWMSEIGPDFWVFCNCGSAQASSIMEILNLPASQVFKVSATDPHPPPYLRVLIAFELCRQQWGQGDWDQWEQQWLSIYPLSDAPTKRRKILASAKRYLPALARVLFRTKFNTLNNREILSLFDLDSVAPNRLQIIIDKAEHSGRLDLSGLSPCGQLALFRTLRNKSKLSEQSLNRLMTSWLSSLAKGRRFTELFD